ncbi:universal stress protein [Agromyces sp. GXS1127]|uniref:universal stress protein n=1 Tax=Agromyces sp. GXS1127 TaxID=3424181 RepID=UPI003D318652
MFTQVVVGWDGSPNSEAALRWAASRGDAAPLLIVHTLPGQDTSSEYLAATGDLPEARVALIDRAARLRSERPGRTIDTITVHGRPDKELAAYLDGGALVVVGASQSGHETAWTLGARLAGRRGRGAVAVIPPDWEAAERRGVVVGVDGSARAKDAVRFGIEEAVRLDEPLELVHAWVVPTSWNSAYIEYLSDVSLMEDMRRDVLDDALAFAREHSAEPEGRLERGAAAAILAEATESASVVIVASHTAGGMARFLLGSVSHDLLLRATGPVIVVSDVG